MKIYTEVNFKWDEDSDELVEISSESYDIDEKEAIANGELALCYCGDYKGDDKAGKADRNAMRTTKGALDDILHQYKKGSDPFDSFYANEMERMAKTSADKKNEAEDRFNLMKDQKQQAFQMSKQKGAMGYEQAVAGTKKELQRMQTKATKQAEGMRSDSASDQYSMALATGKGGMAGTGGRAGRMMAARAKKSIGGVGLELANAREQAKEQLRESEQTTNLNVSEQAMGLQQANQAAEQEMNQTKDNLARETEAFNAKMLQEQSSAMDSLRSEARGAVSAVSSSFQNTYSTWGRPGDIDNRFDGGQFEPNWWQPFDDWDEEQGLDTGWSDAHGG
tara:strand:- start:4973 stop:5977 length:1005 start_codon:yes stop_codon:yes gene_type:complete